MGLSPFLGLNFLKKVRGSVRCSWMSAELRCWRQSAALRRRSLRYLLHSALTTSLLRWLPGYKVTRLQEKAHFRSQRGSFALQCYVAQSMNR